MRVGTPSSAEASQTAVADLGFNFTAPESYTLPVTEKTYPFKELYIHIYIYIYI